MKIIADTNKVALQEFEALVSGAYRDKTIDVELSPEYDGLSVWAIFDRQSVKVEGGKCYTPTLEKGTCSVGIYAVRLNNENEIDLRYSPAPALINIEQGSYNSSLNSAAVPTESEAEQIYALIDEAIKAGMLKGDQGTPGKDGAPGKDGYTPIKGVDYFDGAKGDKGEKGDKGDRGEQGIQGIQGLPGEKGEQGIQGVQGEKGEKGEPGTTDYNELANVPIKNINFTLQNYTFLADIEDGMYFVQSTGYIKTTGGRVVAIGVGTEIIVVTYSGVKSMTYQTGKTVSFLNDSMTSDDKVYSWLNTSHKDLSISSAATDDTLPTSKAVYNFVKAQETQIITDSDNSVIPAFELADNTEYRFTTEIESIEFTLPELPTDDYISSLVFKSGTTATTITYPDTIKWTGDDISSDKFVPASSKTYEVLLYWNGIDYCGIVKGVKGW